MSKTVPFLAAAALSLAVASPALAGWDRTQVVDPAFSRSYDRQLELAAERVAPTPVEQTGSAVSTNDWSAASGDHFWFGPELDRAAGRVGSPHND